MRILVADVWSVYNAGDRAILEALLDGLTAHYPEARIAVAAHFPEGLADLPGIEVVADVLAFDEPAYLAQLAAVEGLDPRLDLLRDAYRRADLVVSTGGYFLNATPGNPFTFVFLSRLLHLGWALDAGVPVALLGQSIGPIEGAGLRAAADGVFSRIPLIAVRDAHSLGFLLGTGLAPHAVLTADLAVTLPPAPPQDVEGVLRRLDLRPGALGISVRHYPGTPPGAFAAVARVADRAVREHGLDVLLIGTTVPPAGAADVRSRERALGNDDSLALREVYERMHAQERARLCEESLPPRLLKGVLGTCRAFLGTRMHATILATTAGVPAAGIAYEYKVAGWFERLGLGDLVVPLGGVEEGALWGVTNRLLADGEALRAHLARALPPVQEAAGDNFHRLASLVPAGAGAVPIPPAPPGAPGGGAAIVASAAGLAPGDPRRVWEQESAHYDVLHRRLRRIVNLAEAHGGTRLLDVGCSAGTIGAALSDGWTYHGCDVSESAVRSARRGWLVPADLEQGIPAFDEQPYDVVVCSGILEYLEDPAALLAALVERVRPGGRLLVSYFNMNHVSRRTGTPFRHPLWRNDLTPTEFRSLLERAGWRVEQTHWSTAGEGAAPDVRDEEAAVRAEPADAAARLDDIGHTLIYVARPLRPTVMVSERLAASVVVPAYNRLDLLQPVLAGLVAQQATGPYEVVLVDDGSEPPVQPLVDALGDPRVRVLRQANRGRGAALNAGLDAARGRVVVMCDSDIVPGPTWLAEHLAFHQDHPGEEATHLGGLVWGVDSGPLGELLGARANPRLIGRVGPVDWTLWYTDNWSFKRALFDRHAFRFDPAFRVWGWEELELAHRLTAVDATSTATVSAVGRHLKPVTLDGLVSNFARSVPNLLHLASRVGPNDQVRDWLGFRLERPEALDLADRLLRGAIGRLTGWWPALEGPAATVASVRIHASDAIFGLGIEHGFARLPAGAADGVSLPSVSERDLLLRYADVAGSAMVAAGLAGDPAGALEYGAELGDLLAGFGDPRLPGQFEARLRARVGRLARAA